MIKRILAALISLAIVLIALISCTKVQNVKHTDTLIIGIENNPTNLDPRLGTDVSSSRMHNMLFNGLLKRDKNLHLQPDLAQSYEISEDGCVYTFYLKDGIRFHDGSLLRAADVQYTYQSVMDPSLASPKSAGYTKLQSITTPDEHTVVFHLSEPFAPFLDNLTLGIVPMKLANDPEYSLSETPVGTGPYMLKEFLTDQHALLERFNDYFAEKAKTRYLKYKIIPDPGIRLLEIKKGSIHLTQDNIPFDSLESLQADDALRVMTTPSTSYKYIAFNMRDAALSKIEVRRALAYAINRDEIIEHLLKGYAVKATGVLAPSHPYYNRPVMIYDYNQSLARRLLDKAGYYTPGAAEAKPRLSLTYLTSQDKLGKQIAEVLQQQWAKIGIKLNIKSYEWGAFYDDVKKGNFQLYSLQWVGISDPDIYYYVFHSASIPPNGANRGHYIEPGLDELLQKGRITTDPEARKRIYHRVQEMVAEQLPYISLWHPYYIAVMRKELCGYELYPNGSFASLPYTYIKSTNK